MSHAPHKLFFKRKGSEKTKMKCEVCNTSKNVRNISKLKGKYSCTSCKNKRLTTRLQKSSAMIQSGSHMTSLEDALSKIYTINGYVNMEGRVSASRNFPTILIGHKVKLVLVE